MDGCVPDTISEPIVVLLFWCACTGQGEPVCYINSGQYQHGAAIKQHTITVTCIAMSRVGDSTWLRNSLIPEYMNKNN
jgi:hypothetical protein